MNRTSFDRHASAAGRSLRCVPCLGFASLGTLALTVALTQSPDRSATRAWTADAAIAAWRGDFPIVEPPATVPTVTASQSVLPQPGAEAAEAPAAPAAEGLAATSAPDVMETEAAAQEEDLPSLAMMPARTDVLGAAPAEGGEPVSDAGWRPPSAAASADADAGDYEDREDVDEDFDPPGRHTQHRVGKGEALGKVLEKLGIAAKDRAKVIAAAKSTPELAKLKAGQVLHARLGTNGCLMALHVPLSGKTSLWLSMEAGALKVDRVQRRGERRLSVASASVQSSLYEDGQDAGLSDQQIAELAAIFGWDVDFALGLRAGDRFSVIYEAEYIDGKKTDDGDILAAEFVNKGKTYRAVRFEDEDGSIGYYAPDGTSKKQAFLRTPIKLARVTSGFSLSRLHPVLQERRAHKGVDYSAPTGTPVKATGTGVVQFSGRQNGYGNVVELQHGDKYTTVYGHLSRFAEGLSVGSRVRQGEVIGYVGQTGLATGPHLHYEFRIAGQHRDPLSVKLPADTPLRDEKLSEFREKSAPLVAKLERLKESTAARAP